MLNDANDARSPVAGTLRAHPIVLVLIGAEFGWLAISATRGGNRLSQDVRDRVFDAVHGASARTRALTMQLRNKVARRRGTQSEAPTDLLSHASEGYPHAPKKSNRRKADAKEAASQEGATLQAIRNGNPSRHYVGRAGEWLSHARDRINGTFNGSVLVLVGLGFIAGAAISLAVPHSTERHEGTGKQDS